MTRSNNTCRRHTSWVELFDPEKYYAVLKSLSSFLTIADFLVLCQACKGFDKLKKCMLRKVSKINVWLSDCMDDTVMFRIQLGNCGALISGAFALSMLELGQRQVQHLDVFVRDGTDADHFTNDIRETENYQEDDQGVETVKKHSLNCSSQHLLANSLTASDTFRLQLRHTAGHEASSYSGQRSSYSSHPQFIVYDSLY